MKTLASAIEMWRSSTINDRDQTTSALAPKVERMPPASAIRYVGAST